MLDRAGTEGLGRGTGHGGGPGQDPIGRSIRSGRWNRRVHRARPETTRDPVVKDPAVAVTDRWIERRIGAVPGRHLLADHRALVNCRVVGVSGEDEADRSCRGDRPALSHQLPWIHHEVERRESHRGVLAVAFGTVVPQHPGRLTASLIAGRWMIGKADTDPRRYPVRIHGAPVGAPANLQQASPAAGQGTPDPDQRQRAPPQPHRGPIGATRGMGLITSTASGSRRSSRDHRRTSSSAQSCRRHRRRAGRSDRPRCSASRCRCCRNCTTDRCKRTSLRTPERRRFPR